MSSDLVRDTPLLDIIFLWQPQMFLGRNVTKHRSAVIRRRRSANTACDVVIARENISHERAEHVKRRAVTESALQLHIIFYLIKRHVAGPFNHDLYAVRPRALGELADRFELRKLRIIGGIRQTARP